MSHLRLTNRLDALVTNNTDNIMSKKATIGCALPATCQWKSFHTLSKNTHASKSFKGSGWGGKAQSPKGHFCMDFFAVVEGNWLMNLNDLQLQLLYLHARILRACRGREASCCYCSGTPSPGAALCCVERVVIDSTGNSFFISTRISTIWYRDPRGVCTGYMKI